MSQKILNVRAMYSNCCGATEWMEHTDICGDCKEHAVFTEQEETNDCCKGCNCQSQSNCQNKK